MLEIKNLHSGYNKIEVLHDINIKVPDGKIVVVIGRNGAGKSTLLNTISGLVKIKSGSIEMNGQKIPSAPHKIVASGIIQVPEGRRIFPSLTIAENLIMGGYLASNAEMNVRKEEVYNTFPILCQRENQQAGTLSGGEQQMLAMGRGMMAGPKILLLDEPSLGLAPLVFTQVFELIIKLNKERNMTIILVEQNATIALKMADYAYVLENGCVVIEGPGEELIKDARVKAAYLGAAVKTLKEPSPREYLE
ncbi:MAG: ABC transporter ATP-binding protein [Chloroflexi bacterium 44-23]|nr:MAG: ABC transporter ATP-binding protein [Chloroflexi bacterium 44-23]